MIRLQVGKKKVIISDMMTFTATLIKTVGFRTNYLNVLRWNKSCFDNPM